MKRKFKTYLKLNMMSLFFIGVSFISVTLAWFAYSGIANVKTEIDVKAWYVEFDDGDETTTNNIVVSLSEIYPGMETTTETITIKNYGDSDAQLDYSIASVRILDDEYTVDDVNYTSKSLEDSLSHDYPFHININLSKKYAKMHDGEASFDISISWPLDSDTDEIDSKWGNDAYTFRNNEELLHNADSSYQVRASLKLVLKVTANQYIESMEAPDMDFDVGDLILFNIKTNQSCTSLSEDCIKTHVISVDSTLGENNVLLLPDLYDDYTESTYANYTNTLNSIVSSWNVNTRHLTVGDILNIVSKDVTSSYLVRPNLSNSLIGTINSDARLQSELLKIANYSGYYLFDSNRFSYLDSNDCYWTNTTYNENNAFAFVTNNSTTTKIYGEDKNNVCRVMPVIIAPKINIETE